MWPQSHLLRTCMNVVTSLRGSNWVVLAVKTLCQPSYSVYYKTLKLFAFVFKEQILACPLKSCRRQLADCNTDNGTPFLSNSRNMGLDSPSCQKEERRRRRTRLSVSRLKLQYAERLSSFLPTRVAWTLFWLFAKSKASREKHNFFIPLAAHSSLPLLLSPSLGLRCL